jgi:hypothetical protein
VQEVVVRGSMILVLALLLAPSSPAAAGQQDRDGSVGTRCHEEIEPYVTFLREHRRGAVDYVLGLFERFDLVIVCERSHPETTQYDLFFDIVRDERFTRRVGHVFTEVGTSTLRPRVEAYLTGASDAVDDAASLRSIYQDLTWSPVWNASNFHLFLERLRGLNETLPRSQRVHLVPSDLPFSWEGMDVAGYRAFRESLGERDRIMAEQIGAAFEAIRLSDDERKKALVIMNYRHAFPHVELRRGERVNEIRNVGGFLMDAYPGRVANVMLNSIRLLPGTTDGHAVFTALQDGKWDAAFRVLGEDDRGFDFEGSPFGKDPFDYFPFPLAESYQDVFTGFVHHVAPGEHRLVNGVPEIMDEAFAAELLRRYRIVNGGRDVESAAHVVDEVSAVNERGYADAEEYVDDGYEAAVARWLL